MSLLARVREMRALAVEVPNEETRHPYARAGETPARRDASRKRHPYARAGLKRPNGDQPKPYEGYVIRVMTPWGASPAPGPVAGH